jgi:hypothetical protein
MNWKKPVTFSLLALAAVFVLQVALRRNKSGPFPNDNAGVPRPSATSAAPTGPSPSVEASISRPASQIEAEREKQIWNLGLVTPIQFYGKVVDEAGNGVSDAEVQISFNDHLGAGNSKSQAFTDANGLFSASGHGLGLAVSVSKEGYYHLPQSNGSFGYAKGAGGQTPHSNPNDPALFVLRKMRNPVSLIHIADKDTKLPKNGAPIELSLTTGKLAPTGQGDIEVEAWIIDGDSNANSNRPYDWRCRISVPGGGLIQRTGQFDFEAPETGYQPADEIEMPATLGAAWRSQASRDYFVKLASGQFARVEFTMTAGGQHFFTITSYLNPTVGDRNLESATQAH